MGKLTVEFCKMKARKHYYKMQKLLGRYSCGFNLASYINPEIAIEERKMKEWISMAKRLEAEDTPNE